MAVPARRRKETPNERARRERAEAELAKRIAQSRPVPRAPNWYAAARALADRFGLDPSDVLDDLDHRAAIIEYDGGIARPEAERRAMAETELAYQAQGALPLL